MARGSTEHPLALDKLAMQLFPVWLDILAESVLPVVAELPNVCDAVGVHNHAVAVALTALERPVVLGPVGILPATRKHVGMGVGVGMGAWVCVQGKNKGVEVVQ